jgi:hypothetical protein
LQVRVFDTSNHDRPVTRMMDALDRRHGLHGLSVLGARRRAEYGAG